MAAKLVLKRAAMLLAVSFIGAAFLVVGEANAQRKGDFCAGANLSLAESGQERSCTNPPGEDGAPGKTLEGTVGSIINIITIVVGIIALIMILIGGFRYVTSGGDASKVSSAKNTIIYAIIGLVVVALAQFIVKYVLRTTTPS
jgi:hypothetical protein